MPTLANTVIHTEVTVRSGYRYQSTPKHHGADPGAAQWLESMSLADEFDIFNSADSHELSDRRGWLYGIHREGGDLRVLGTWAQQIAEFPASREPHPWHGYPIWAINGLAPENRRGEQMRPHRDVFLKMETAGLLTTRQRKRLFKGDHA